MSDVIIRRVGRVGRITLNRPAALNALSHTMVRAIDAALRDWAGRDDIEMLLIDAAGEKAFCAGGDIAEIYDSGRQGDFGLARGFWRTEYAMNARLFHFPKPVVSFMQGFTMGGGVGVGCHGSHRIVGRSSRVAMPECGIGLVPDVGGSLILGRAPGRIGEYLGTTGARMGAADAILAGFADYHIDERHWPGLIAGLERTGDCTLIDAAATAPGDAPLADIRAGIDRHFSAEGLVQLLDGLRAAPETDFTRATLAALSRVSPLSAAATLALVRAVRQADTIEQALAMEYRFTHRAMEQGDFLEGIRAAIVDKDKAPRWRYGAAEAATQAVPMLRPLGAEDLVLGGATQ